MDQRYVASPTVMLAARLKSTMRAILMIFYEESRMLS